MASCRLPRDVGGQAQSQFDRGSPQPVSGAAKRPFFSVVGVVTMAIGVTSNRCLRVGTKAMAGARLGEADAINVIEPVRVSRDRPRAGGVERAATSDRGNSQCPGRASAAARSIDVRWRIGFHVLEHG